MRGPWLRWLRQATPGATLRLPGRLGWAARAGGQELAGAGEVRALGGDGCCHGQKVLRIPSVRLLFLLFLLVLLFWFLRPARVWF